jgi:hypothetical protein
MLRSPSPLNVEVRVINAATGAGIPDVALNPAHYQIPNFHGIHGPNSTPLQVAGGADPVRLEIEMYQSLIERPNTAAMSVDL